MRRHKARSKSLLMKLMIVASVFLVLFLLIWKKPAKQEKITVEIQTPRAVIVR